MKFVNQSLSFIFLITFLNACTQASNKENIKTATTCTTDRIPAAEADTMISQAQAYITSINNSLETEAIKIPFGAKIPICEMQEILNQLGDTPETWAMMAMDDGELTIIFQGKKEGTDEYLYYDFTMPCPKKCPN